MILGNVYKHKKLTKKFHENFIHLIIMGIYYKNEMMIIGNIINILPKKSDFYIAFENQLVQEYSKKSDYSILSQMKIIKKLIKLLLIYGCIFL